MKRLTLGLLIALILAIPVPATAAQLTYGSWAPWSPGMGFGSPFSSSWTINTMGKTEYFDTTITWIDNVRYGWHFTLRSTNTFMRITWFSSDVKKAHCVANAYSGKYAGCTVYG